VRILGLDPGTKRVGVAISDELKTIATPLECIPAEPFKRLVARLKELIAARQVERIVVGMPRNMDGSYGPAAARVQQFVAALQQAIDLPIQTWDERLTTVMADRLLRQAELRSPQRKAKVDAAAAALLLQSYLDALGSG
jgi:putative Holliday junction resolvase